MNNKDKSEFVLPSDTDETYNEDYEILTYKPNIGFVEPEQEPISYNEDPPEESTDDTRDKTKTLINNLDNLSKLFGLAQQRVDNKVKAGGGVTIKLDPVKDAATIAAMKRKFPDKADPTQLTYDDYKDALECINNSVKSLELVTEKDLLSALSDPLRTDFGGYGNQKGENRPELSNNSSSVEPVDMDAFKKGAVIALFLLLLPLIVPKIKAEIAEHLITAPHSPI